MLTIPEIMEQLRVSRETVHGWIKAGLLEAADVSPVRSRRKCYRVAPEALAKFLTLRGQSDIMLSVPVTKQYLRR